MWEKKEKDYSPADWGYYYKINDCKVVVIKQYSNIIEGFVYEPSGRCSNYKESYCWKRYRYCKIQMFG